MVKQSLLIQNRICHIYGTPDAEYLMLQMADEHDLAGMEREVEAIHLQTAHTFLLAAVQVEHWNYDLSPWPAPPVWVKQGFGGKAGDTLAWLEQAVPSICRQYSIKEDGKVILGGYSLAGLFALWAATQTDTLYSVAAASPSVWFPVWLEHEAAHPIQTRRVYLSLGDREEHTKNKSAEPKQVRVPARKYRRSTVPPSRKQKASPRREAPQGCAQASEGAGYSLQKRFRENLAVKLNRFCRSTNLF